jgi:hypothetical protein
MKRLLVILFLLITNYGFGQSVTSPEPKSFIINTAAQDASGFSLSGFNSTATLLCAIGLPSAPTGTTFYLTTSTGLTPASGYTMSGNKTRLAFTGTMANINNALATLKINTTATAGTVQISVSATVNPTGFFYNPSNGHFYRPISTGATYTAARAASLLTTFKGQTGYLVTITSADEDAFIFANVPQSSIWFALTDEASEARWTIDAGPEKGTLIKINNGQLNGNIPGQYNNWAGGEPNNSGDEDYAVTKWGGGSQWNDLPNHFSCAYVIEYGTWSNPDDQTFTEFYSNSVNHSNGNILRTEFNFNFGSNVDETMFKTRILTSNDNVTFSSNNPYISLNGVGRVNMTSQMDTAQINGSGVKASTTTGQVEWCVIYEYDSYNQRYRIGIDSREVNNILSNPSSINSLQLFDLWNGPVTFNSYDPNGWTEVYVYTNTQFNFTGSSFSSFIRAGNGFYGLRAEFTFTQNRINKFHKIALGNLTTTQNANLLSSIVTVSDVYLAFREFADRGIMGNESKYFTSGIQFHNADVNEDSVFDEKDCYSLLTHLQGTTSLWQSTPIISDAIKIIPSSTFDNITKQNWNTLGLAIGVDYPFTFTNGILNSYSLDVSWKGDVNLSHSSQPTGFILSSSNGEVSQIKSMSMNSIGAIEADIMMEKVNDSIIATIKLIPNGNEIGATQFIVHYDNSVLDFSKVEFTNNQSTNFGKNNGQSMNIGSLNTSGGSISNIEYKITFKPKTTITNILGLISVQNVETLGINLNKLSVKIK